MLAVVLLCTGLLVGLGTTAGYGIGQGVQWVRDVWPDPAPELLAEKIAPPDPLEVGGVAKACASDAVDLDLAGNATTLTPGDPVDLTLGVTNVGHVPCLVDASSANLRVTVTDADGERVWSSADCTGRSEKPAMLGPGESWQVTTRWSGSTSNAKCEGKPSEVAAGVYTLTPALHDLRGAQGRPLTLAVEAPAPEPKTDEPAADQADDADASEDSEGSDESRDQGGKAADDDEASAADGETSEKSTEGSPEKESSEKSDDEPADDGEAGANGDVES